MMALMFFTLAATALEQQKTLNIVRMWNGFTSCLDHWTCGLELCHLPQPYTF